MVTLLGSADFVRIGALAGGAGSDGQDQYHTYQRLHKALFLIELAAGP
jgi:hypothetical protein